MSGLDTAVDGVIAAAAAADVHLGAVNVYWHNPRGTDPVEITARLSERDLGSALRLFAVLGVAAECSAPYGSGDARQAHVEATVPALGGVTVCVYVREGLPVESSDQPD